MQEEDKWDQDATEEGGVSSLLTAVPRHCVIEKESPQAHIWCLDSLFPSGFSTQVEMTLFHVLRVWRVIMSLGLVSM